MSRRHVIDRPAEDGTQKVIKTTAFDQAVDRAANNRQQRALDEIDAQGDVPFEVAYRGIEPGDFHFILNAWLRSYRTVQKAVKNDPYYKGQQNLIAEIAKRRTCIISCDRDKPHFIFGFIAGQLFESGRTLIDYVYVKEVYRQRGIARGLLTALGFQAPCGATITHYTPEVVPFVKAHKLDYNPYYNMLGYSDV